MKPLISAFFSGLIFSLGLGVGGMTHPENIIGFLDLSGNWKPALIFVMAGAILVYSFSNRLIMRRSRPIFDQEFHIPRPGKIDLPLLLGSIIFGVGWGLGGFCPGPAIVALGAGVRDAVIFVLFMLLGMWIQQRTLKV